MCLLLQSGQSNFFSAEFLYHAFFSPPWVKSVYKAFIEQEQQCFPVPGTILRSNRHNPLWSLWVLSSLCYGWQNRLKESKPVSQGHTAKQWSQSLNPGLISKLGGCLASFESSSDNLAPFICSSVWNVLNAFCETSPSHRKYSAMFLNPDF